MPYSPSDPWLLPVLTRMSLRPGMFLGDENVKTLATFIHAYGQARLDLGVPEMGNAEASLLADFEKWLAVRLGDTRDVAWATLVAVEDSSERNVRTFFLRFDEFLRERGESAVLSSVNWPPKAENKDG